MHTGNAPMSPYYLWWVACERNAKKYNVIHTNNTSATSDNKTSAVNSKQKAYATVINRANNVLCISKFWHHDSKFKKSYQTQKTICYSLLSVKTTVNQNGKRQEPQWQRPEILESDQSRSIQHNELDIVKLSDVTNRDRHGSCAADEA